MKIALLSTSDTDLLSARASGADYVWANPARPAHEAMAATLEGCDLVVARILGSPQDLCTGLRAVPRRPGRRWWCSAASSSRTPS